MNAPASLPPHSLIAELTASRARLTRITCDLEGERLLGPQLAIVNPPLWELGHVAWFQEFWCLRYREGRAPEPSVLPHADKLYDSAKVAHDTRWGLPLPDITHTRAYQANVLERVAARHAREPDNPALHYFLQLALFHEDMHAEAFYYTHQTLGYANPLTATHERPAADKAVAGDAAYAGGLFELGAKPSDGFVFDNEKWAHPVQVAPFRIAHAPVTNAEYLGFVESDGYTRRELWDDEGWAWRESTQARAPRYWVRRGRSWAAREFDVDRPLRERDPVIHVNWHEAQAYCRYARRRLPTEAEWEYAAAYDASNDTKRRYPWGNNAPTKGHANLEGAGVAAVDAYSAGDNAAGCRQMIGNVWEWTASTFDAYPGFTVDPYKEYSEPWFGTHKVLRGGSFATTRSLIRNTWRNFYTPDRGDVFAGFRTCAL